MIALQSESLHSRAVQGYFPQSPVFDVSALSIFPDSVEMLHVKPVSPKPNVSRPRAHLTSRGKANGLAVQVSSVAQQLGNTITGWLLSELTVKSARNNVPSKTYTLKKVDGDVLAEYTTPKAGFLPPKQQSSPGHLGIPVGRERPASPNEMTVVAEEVDEEDITTAVELPRVPPPARTGPPPLPSEPTFPTVIRKPPPSQSKGSLPTAPKQLLPPRQPTPSKSTQRKPAHILIDPPPSPKDELEHLPTLSFSPLSIPYLSALDSPSTTAYSVPQAPLISSTSFDDDPPYLSHRPKFHRTSSTPIDNNAGFTFDFPAVVSEKDIPRHRSRRPRGRLNNERTGSSQCMQDFVEEYVQMRRRQLRRTGRDQRFPVAGQLMCITNVGSVYTFKI